MGSQTPSGSKPFEYQQTRTTSAAYAVPQSPGSAAMDRSKARKGEDFKRFALRENKGKRKRKMEKILPYRRREGEGFSSIFIARNSARQRAQISPKIQVAAATRNMAPTASGRYDRRKRSKRSIGRD